MMGVLDMPESTHTSREPFESESTILISASDEFLNLTQFGAGRGDVPKIPDDLPPVADQLAGAQQCGGSGCGDSSRYRSHWQRSGSGDNHHRQ
mmetsp:Transcript_126136/g.217729  ORF Transcript_126136/g.217729 Transcript_126136/m.217729 type:complete len:93 (-) Transcript_126136:38-316(-)